MSYPLLERINAPGEIKNLPASDMPALCEEIRQFLIKSVSETGGHLSSNLGVVELTVALHRVLDFPQDKLLFDVGHQCYTHKLLTGRREGFAQLRRKNGIADAKALADTDELFHLDDTQRDLKKSLDLWYSAFGKRNPRTEKGADRPLYSITNSDYVQAGYLGHQAEAEVGEDTAKLHDTFLKLMVWSTARILKGEPMGTIPEKDLKAAEKANREAMSERAKKAAETRKANEQAKAEVARKQREEEKRVKTMEARLAKMESDAKNVAKVIAMVQASHATEDEKTAIINALTENSAHQVTELIDDGKAHTEKTAA